MENFLKVLTEVCTTYGLKVLGAVLVWIIGKIIIGKLMKGVEKLPYIVKQDPTVALFICNFVKVLLYVILVIAMVSILGIPMASVIAVLASAGVAVGMALQGSLSNLAGGLMLLVFRPFKVGDYVATAGEEGIVQQIALFYTTLLTLDNRRVTIPNGTLMNANVVNYSHEETRRVDLTFGIAKSEDLNKVTEIMERCMKENEMVLEDPAPFAGVISGTNESMVFTVRAWCKSANYWDVYFALTKAITEELGKAGIKAPAVRIVNE